MTRFDRLVLFATVHPWLAIVISISIPPTVVAAIYVACLYFY
jgi:hypothetical protein